MARILTFAIVAVCLPGVPAAKDAGLQTIHSRLYAGIMAGCSASCKDAAGYARSMRPDGSWANINYNSTDRVVWSAATHWQNLKTMATAMHCEPCQPPPPPSSAYLASIKRGVDYWLSKDYLNPNWWWNDFGVPMSVAPLSIVMANVTTLSGNGGLSPAQMAGILSLVARGADPMWHCDTCKRGGHYTGTNLVWSLELDIQRGVVSNNATLVRAAFTELWSSLVVSPQAGDGVMADGSFHQHGPLLQNGAYGMDLMSDTLAHCTLARGTEFGMPLAPLTVLVDYLLDGQQYMVRGSGGTATLMIAPRGRDVTRPNDHGLFPSAGVADGIAMLLNQPNATALPRKADLQMLYNRLTLGGASTAPLGNNADNPYNPTRTRHYPASDYTVHHRRRFSNDIRTWSNRTFNSECVNAENTLGGQLADGAAYTHVIGDEYYDIFPAWDWQKVPGVLATADAMDRPCAYERLGGRAFVGGVHVNRDAGTLGASSVGGVVAMDFRRSGAKAGNPGGSAVLTARRAWFLLDVGFVSLTANISYNGATAAVTTALEQNNLDGAVESGTWSPDVTGSGPSAARRWRSTPEEGNSSWPLVPSNGRYVAHRNITYATFPDTGGKAQSLHASVGNQSGSWQRISTTLANATVIRPVFKLWIDHGAAPFASRSSAYAVLPALNLSDAACGSTACAVGRALSPVTVVNTHDRQVLVLAGPTPTLMAVAYSPGTVIALAESDAGYGVVTDTALLFTLEQNATHAMFSYSSPVAVLKNGGVATLTIGGLRLVGGEGGAGCHRVAADRSIRSGGSSIVTLRFDSRVGVTNAGSCEILP